MYWHGFPLGGNAIFLFNSRAQEMLGGRESGDNVQVGHILKNLFSYIGKHEVEDDINLGAGCVNPYLMKEKLKLQGIEGTLELGKERRNSNNSVHSAHSAGNGSVNSQNLQANYAQYRAKQRRGSK